MWAGVSQGGIISPVLFILYVNDMLPHSHIGELALYADDTAIKATFRKPTLLESYLNEFQRCLSDWRIAIKVTKSTAIIFCSCRTVLHPAPTTKTVRGTNRMGRHYSLFGGDSRYATHLVA